MIIKELPKSEYQDYKVLFDYTTDSYYETIINKTENGYVITLDKKQLETPVSKEFSSTLFKSFWEQPQAFGCFDEEKLIGLVEVSKGQWDKRVRVTNIRVDKEYRRTNVGTLLMNRIKELAKKEGYRAIILETQTFNTKAIDFYLKQGFVFGGFDASCYSNSDIEKHEVRIELQWYL